MDELDRSDWARVRLADNREALQEASFVLSAIGVEHMIDREDFGWVLLVPVASAERATTELDNYQRENRRTPQPPARLTVIDRGWAGVAGYLFVIWMLPTLEWQLLGLPWRDAGDMHASLVMTGQWWRTITALTLHADLGHLVANSMFGVVMGILVGRNFGSGLGWLLILICGAAGNALDAALRLEDFHSIGASTATFAAVGLVGGFVWRRGYFRTIRSRAADWRATNWRRSFAPIAAAIALFAFTGTSGENTDVVAHVMGLTTGLGCGVVVAGFDVRRIGFVGQCCAGLAALGLVAAAWWMALAG